jgi:hypothetical protein
MKKYLQIEFYKNLISKINNPVVLIVALSLLLTTGISALIGVGGYLLFSSFWGTFIIAFGLQFVVFAIINGFLQRKDLIEGTKIINEQLEAISKFTVRLTCSYCKKPNMVPILLDQENRFKCESCNQVNGVKMQFFATQITTPLNNVLLPVGENESIVFKTSLS